jgi:cytochrome P450
MPSSLTLGLGLGAVVLYALYRAHAAFFPPTGLGALPGPKSSHPFFGNMREVFDGATAVPHERWVRAHGPVLAYRALLNVRLPHLACVRTNECVQRPRLMTTDLRALQHVLQRTDVYHKPEFVVRDISATLGAGILVAEGEQHRAQRKALNPAFGPAQLRELTGVITDKAQAVKHAPALATYTALTAKHSSAMHG